jgi:glycosyltransferase involved in cell wall biosynthesis
MPVFCVLAPEPIRPRMAGMGIRALELARALSRRFDVRLLVPNDEGEAREAAGAAPLRVVFAPPGTLADAARGAAAALVSGHAANSWFHEAPDVPVAADLYDPFPIENLHYAALLGPETARHDRATLELALGRADFFLCASAEQRLFYAGALFSCGRIAEEFADDPSLAGLLAILPFGVPAAPASGDRARGRAAVGVAADGPLVLFGGVYDWYDPAPLLEAWPAVRRLVPGARLLFFENPNPDTTPQRVFERTRRRAREVDPVGESVVFSPWLPYAARADLYAACDAVVSIASPGLETELAYRTRLLDAAWGGVPAVSINGGSLARELASAGACLEAPAEPAVLADAVASLLSDPARRARASEAARRFAAGRTWDAVAAPLLAWAANARVAPSRRPLPDPAGRRASRLARLFQ